MTLCYVTISLYSVHAYCFIGLYCFLQCAGPFNDPQNQVSLYSMGLSPKLVGKGLQPNQCILNLNRFKFDSISLDFDSRSALPTLVDVVLGEMTMKKLFQHGAISFRAQS